MIAYDLLTKRHVSRLCHFTKLKSLSHILSSEEGVLASNSIRSDVKDVVDTQRYDGELEHVCCSIEYPNSWFLKKAIQRDTDRIFKEWVVIFISLDILNHRNAKFCSCNAAKCSGKYIFDDAQNIYTLFEKTVNGRPRSSKMLPCCPTDDQAEILINKNIPRDFIVGIAVGNKEIAERVYAMLLTYKVNNIPIYLSPNILSTDWSQMVRLGQKPNEDIVFEMEAK